jgi:hypothetical protein
MIIKTDQGMCIKVESLVAPSGYVWGWRWNKHEGRWFSQCMLHKARLYIEVKESELPVIKPIDIAK